MLISAAVYFTTNHGKIASLLDGYHEHVDSIASSAFGNLYVSAAAAVSTVIPAGRTCPAALRR